MTTGEGRRTVYIETSVVSYLTARPTSHLLAAAWQKTTADWWDAHRPPVRHLHVRSHDRRGRKGKP